MHPTITQPNTIRQRARSRFGVLPAAALALAMVVSGPAALAAPAMSQPNAGGTQLVAVPGSISRLALSNTRVQLGVTAATQPLTLELSMRGQNAAGLQLFLQQVNRRGSPLYHHYLTPTQYALQFGPTPQALTAVTTFLQSNGLTISRVYSGGQLITVRTTVGQAEQVFHVQIDNYRAPAGYTYYAANTNPLVPASVATLLGGTSGWDSAARPRPLPTPASAIPPQRRTRAMSGPPSNSGGYTPDQMRTAYDVSPLLAGGQDGTGRTIDLFEFDGFQQFNVDTFDSYYGLTPPVPTVVPIDGGVIAPSFGEGEVELDIEVLQEIAPKVHINVYEAPISTDSDFFSEYAREAQAMASAHDADVASASWGYCESLWDMGSRVAASAAFQQMAAEGMDAFVAAGDDGAAACWYSSGNPYGVIYPAADPNVTSVGGTTLTLNTDDTYKSEVVWNNAANAYGGHLDAGSGGISTIYTMPSYQVGPGVVNGYSNGNRELPDVTANGDYDNSPYDVYLVGGWMANGGTSAAAPLYAAIAELADEYALAHGRPTNGFVNPALYALAAGTPPYPPFHDVTVGDNDPLSPKHSPVFYPATSGYDLASGLGSPDAYNLARDLSASPASCAAPPPTLPATGLSNPSAVAVDAACDVFIADAGNNRVVELPAGGGQVTVASGLNQPEGVAVDGAGALYIADTGNKRVLKLTAGGGTPVPMPISGLCSPEGLATDTAGDLYIADGCGWKVVKVMPSGAQSTVGGSPYDPDAVAVDGAGNVYIASFDGNQVIKVAPSGAQSTLGINLYGPAGLAVDAAGTVYISDYFHARVLAVTAAGVQFRLPLTGLNHPSGLALDSAGTLYLADFSNNRVLSVSNPGTNTGWTATGFNGPEGVAVDGAGDTFVADTRNNRIIEVGAAGAHTTVQGATSLDQPAGVAIDSAGTLYIADTGNDRVIKVTAAGVETTVPVSGLGLPLGVAVDGAGDLYIADESGNQVIKLTANGTRSSVPLSGLDHPGGVAVDGAGNLYVSNAYSGTVLKLTPGGVQTTILSGLTFPSVGVAGDGTVYASDWGRHQVVRLSTGGAQSDVLVGQLNNPAGVAVDSSGTLYVADYGDNRVVKLTAGGTQSNL